MIEAELHGHAARLILDNEDYLTSAVFEHLRYVQPGPFWQDFFSRCSGAGAPDQSLLDYLRQSHGEPSAYSSLDISFWPSHCELGTPDLCLCFSGGRNSRPAVILVEAKLWSGKSGTGENDQLLRYLLLLERLHELQLPVPANDVRCAIKALLFLTPHDATVELRESVSLCQPHPGLAAVLFGARWQDITTTASMRVVAARGNERLILRDISDFLRHRNLAYFGGFAHLPVPPGVSGAFYCRREILRRVPIPKLDSGAGLFYTRHRR